MRWILPLCLAAVLCGTFWLLRTTTAEESLKPEQATQVVIRPVIYPAPAKLAGYEQEVKTFRVTAYTLDDPGMRPKTSPYYGQAASGVYAQEGVTVACGPEYPFGTVFLIEGIGPRVCQDRGGAIDDGDLDIYFRDREKALRFGVQDLRAVVMRLEAAR